MIAIVTRWHKRLTALILCQQTETGSVVPTARTLAKISTDCAHVPDLRTCYFDSSLANHRKRFADLGVVNQLLNRDQRSDPQAFVLAHRNAAQLLYVLYVYQAFRRDNIILH